MQRTFLLAAAAALGLAGAARAADWSDTALGFRYGTHFAEPYDNNPDGSRRNIGKNIISLTHADGFKYGTNFFNVDLLLSDSKDPGAGTTSGAQEAYLVYRNLLDIGKVAGRDFKMGGMRGVGLTSGFDFNTKNDTYGSKKRMFVVGPTVMFDVPGFLNFSVLALFESNAPQGVSRYRYDTHAAAELDWSIPVFSLPLSFNGYALYIGSKGRNEFGGATSPETHIDTTLMYDVSPYLRLPQHAVLIGVEFEYWRNKFGNPTRTPPAGGGKGATARTPMVRAEYHF